MSQPPCGGALPSDHQGGPNFPPQYFPVYPMSGGWEEQESPVLSWMENQGQGGHRRRVLPPNAVAAAPSNPFVGVSSAEMDSGSSFTNLIMDGLPPAGVSENACPPNEIQSHDEVPAPAKGNQKRSKNFTVDEDKMLVSAWLNVSLDAVRGANQSKTTYWKRIYEYFHSNKKFDSDRSQASLMSRWSSIQHDCNTFCHCVSRVEARNQSGASVDDKQANALTLYKKEDPSHKTFQYIHCWKILKDQSKWKERRLHIGPQNPASKKQKTVARSTPTEASIPATSNADDTQANMDRPAGNKKEKAKLRQRSSVEVVDYLLAKKKEADAEKELKKEERELKKQERDLKKQESCQKALALQEEKIKLEKDKFEFERDLQEERIMNVDMSSLSAKQQEFYALLQDKILAKRLQN